MRDRASRLGGVLGPADGKAPRRRAALACGIGAAALLLAAPSVAGATLVFVRKPLKPVVWVAHDNGSGAHRLAAGTSPRVSPDGRTVVYMKVGGGPSYNPSLMVVAADAGRRSRRLARGWRDSFTFAFSPDSQEIATVLGPELGRRRLVVIDLASGARRTIATGYFYGVSFSPNGERLLYARSAGERYPPRSDIYSARLAGGAPRRITDDHRSLYPLWGPKGGVVFVRMIDAGRRRYGPKNELYTMNADGGHRRRLTHTHVGALLQGLTPTQWSASGRRLLAEFGGQDTSYAVRVNPRTGAQHALGGRRGLLGTALSADGRRVLGSTGGPEPLGRHNVVSVAYGGGPAKVLARNALEPDWSR